jgi:hypothetical protein
MKTSLSLLLGACALALGVFGVIEFSHGYATLAGWTPHPVIDAKTASPSDLLAAEAGTPVTVEPTLAQMPSSVPADERANDINWVRTQTLTDSCMKRKGFDYIWGINWQTGEGAGDIVRQHLTASRLAAANRALSGSPDLADGAPWQKLGCQGYVAHVMGN